MIAEAARRRGAAAPGILVIGLLVSGCTAAPGAPRAATSAPATKVTADAAALRARFAHLATELGVPSGALVRS